MGEKGVLLRFVEAMNFVDKNNRLVAEAARLFRHGHDVFNFFDARQHRAEWNERRLRHSRDGLGERRLADARRSPQDHRWNLVALNRCP